MKKKALQKQINHLEDEFDELYERVVNLEKANNNKTFTLKRVTRENVEHYYELGGGFTLILRDNSPNDFEHCISEMDEEIQNREIYALLLPDIIDSDFHPLEEKEKYYILTENGLFQDISYKNHFVDDNKKVKKEPELKLDEEWGKVYIGAGETAIRIAFKAIYDRAVELSNAYVWMQAKAKAFDEAMNGELKPPKL